MIKVVLYNIIVDLIEYIDFSKEFFNEVEKLQERVQYYMKGVVFFLKKLVDEMVIKVVKEKGYWGSWRI